MDAAGAIEAVGTAAAGDIVYRDVEGRADALPFFLMSSPTIAINSPKATGKPMPIEVNAVDHLVLNVTDAERSAAWYERVLGMKRLDFNPGHGRTTRISMLFGNQKINLRPVTTDKQEWFTADHEAAGSDDLCFLTTATPQDVIAHFKDCGVAIEEGPVEKQGARGTLISVYCRDPDGSLIEVSSYRG